MNSCWSATASTPRAAHAVDYVIRSKGEDLCDDGLTKASHAEAQDLHCQEF